MNKPSKIFLIISVTITVCIANRFDKASLEMDRLLEYSLDIQKMLADGEVGNNQDTIQVQALANKFVLYGEDFHYTSNKAILHAKTGKLKESLKNLTKLSEIKTYPIAKFVNDDTRTLKKYIRKAFSDYSVLFSMAKEIDKMLQKEDQNEITRHYSRKSFSNVIFNFNVVHGELKYRNKTVQEISKEISLVFNKIFGTLKQFRGVNQNGKKTLEHDVHIAIVFIERLTRSVERWVYIYKGENEKATYISGWTGRLWNIINTFLRKNHSKSTFTEFCNNLEIFLQGSLAELKSFIEFEKRVTVKREKEMCKEVLLESLNIYSALGAELDIIIQLQ